MLKADLVFNCLKVDMIFNCQKVDLVFNCQKADLVARPKVDLVVKQILVGLLRQEYEVINEDFNVIMHVIVQDMARNVN